MKIMARLNETVLVTASLACATVMVGCTVGPDYERPDVNMPGRWNHAMAEAAETSAADLQQWWTLLGDVVLNDLIDQAGRANLDARASLMRVAQSRALRDFTAGRAAPQLDGIGAYSRMRDSAETRFAAPGMPTDPYDLHTVGFDAAWEIDLFGQIRRSVESSQASFEASIDDYYDVLRTLYAEVARNYVELRTIQARLQYAHQNIDAQRQTVELTEGRFKAGLSGELDVAQAKLNLANTEAEVPALRLAEIQTINRIAVLLGCYPQELQVDIAGDGPIPEAVEPGAPGLPADLLRRRPDIRRTERELAAQTARIGVATADLYPSFTLSGVFTLQAEDFGDIGKWNSRAYSFGPAFRWHILDGDRVRSNIRAETAATEQARLHYEQTVLLAVEEVENALASLLQDRQRLAALQRSTNESERSVRLVQELYTNGLTDFQNVLDMQRTLWMQQDRLAAGQGEIVLDLIRLYKALGGGWPMERPEPQGPASSLGASEPQLYSVERHGRP